MISQASRLMAEVRALLEGLRWDGSQSIYLEGERAAITLDPRPAEPRGHFYLPLTVIPLEGEPGELEGLSVGLHHLAKKHTHYGRLNGRGQLVFNKLVPGPYRVSVGPTLAPEETAWPAAIRQAVTTHFASLLLSEISPEPHTCVSADGLLRVTLQRETDEEVHLAFTGEKIHRQGTLVGFIWMPGPRLRFAILPAPEAARTTVLKLFHRMPNIHLGLPLRPWSPALLAKAPTADIEASILLADFPQQWRQLLAIPELSMSIKEIIQHRTRSIWEWADGIRCLIPKITARVQAGQVNLVDLPDALSPFHRRLTGPALLSGDDETPEVERFETVQLSDPDKDLLVDLAVHHARSNLSTVQISVATAEPVTQAWVSLYQEGALLEADSTFGDGGVFFSELPPGRYTLQVKYSQQVWQLYLELKDEP